MEWRNAIEKNAERDDSGRAVETGMQDHSGVRLYADKANPRLLCVPDVGGLPALPRVFRCRCSIGKRSAPGVRDRYPLWDETRPAGLGPPQADRARPKATPTYPRLQSTRSHGIHGEGLLPRKAMSLAYSRPHMRQLHDSGSSGSVRIGRAAKIRTQRRPAEGMFWISDTKTEPAGRSGQKGAMPWLGGGIECNPANQNR